MKILNKIINKVLGRNNDNIMSFKAGFDLTELPVVTFYNGENKLNFLLDTGSNNCIIDSNIIDNIEHTKSDSTSTVFGLEGNKQNANICTITLTYNDNDYTYDYLVVDMKEAFNQMKTDTGVTLHGLLGSNFFNKFKYVLDFNELIAYSKQ